MLKTTNSIDSLGCLDKNVARIGFGCAGIGGYDYGPTNDEESKKAIRHAIESGINFFDTADVYGLGHSESLLGEVLGKDREHVVLATKVGVRFDQAGQTHRDLSPEWIHQALENSLKRLRTDTIDLYQLHWPDDKVPLEKTIEALLRPLESGVIKSIGCCNFPRGEVEKLSKWVPVASVQESFNVLWRENFDVLYYSKNTLGALTLTYNALGHGYLSGKYDSKSVFHPSDLRKRQNVLEEKDFSRLADVLDIFKHLAMKYNKSIAQVALRWVLDSSVASITLVGIKKAWQVDENAGTLGWTLSSDDLNLIEQVAQPEGSYLTT